MQEGSALQPRSPDAYMPFGAGARLCIGRPFANQALAITLARLYARYHFELVQGQVPLALKQTFALVPARGIHVRVLPRAAGQQGRGSGGGASP